MAACTPADGEWDDPILYLAILDARLDEWRSEEDAAAFVDLDAVAPPPSGAAE